MIPRIDSLYIRDNNREEKTTANVPPDKKPIAMRDKIYCPHKPEPDEVIKKSSRQWQYAKLEQKTEYFQGFDICINDCENYHQYTVNSLSIDDLQCGVAWTQGDRSTMEDTYVAETIQFEHNKEAIKGQLYGVFDGHAGKGAAEYIASNIAPKLQDLLTQVKTADLKAAIPDILTHAFVKLDEEIEEKKIEGGTTATCAVVVNGHYYVPNVGDSRTISIQADNIDQMTEDSWPGYERFKRALRKEKVPITITRDDGVTRANNISVARNIGLPALHLSPRPKITQKAAEDEEILILASDGLWEVGSTNQLGKAVQKNKDLSPSEIARLLTTQALIYGTTDNTTVIVVKLSKSSMV